MSALDDLCRVAELSTKTEMMKAELLIWYAMRLNHRDAAYLPFVLQLFRQAQFASPNLARLRRNLIASKHVLSRPDKGDNQFSLRRDILERFDKEYPSIFGAKPEAPLKLFEQKLGEKAANLPEPLRTFLQEAIGCMTHEYYRAAVVLSWQGAMGVIEQRIFDDYLENFNSEAAARKLIKKPITKVGDFQKLQETDKLLVAEAAGAITKSVKTALEECLRRRNNCGHPNDFDVGEAQVAAHIESLLGHVFTRP